MARLPVPGSDGGVWGQVLNDYLSVSHQTDGTIKNGAVSGASIQDDTIVEAKLDAAARAKLNQAGNGDPAVGGDLSGTASNAQIVANAVDTTALATGSVTSLKLASDAVTEPKLAVSNSPSTNNVLSWDGTNMTWTAAGSGGETNTASSVGVGGVGVYKQKTGVNLEFKSINAGSNKVTVTNDAGNNEIDIDVNTANFALAKTDVGLANVDNTSDANKPVSSATLTALNAKANNTVTVTGATSLTGGGDLSANRTISLVGDASTPGNNRYYGTDGTGTKGFYVVATQDPTVGGDLSGTASNAQIVAGAVGSTELGTGAVTDAKVATGIAQSKISNLTSDLAAKEPTITAGTTGQYWRGDKSWQTHDKSSVGLANVDNTSDANKPVSSATLTALNAKLDDKNEIVALTDSTNDRFVRVNITDDATATSGWPDRLAFYFSGVRTGYHNEYGELRARPGKNNTVALRALGWNGVSSADIFQVADTSQTTVYLGVSSTAATLTVPVTSTANITTTGTITGANVTTGGNVTATGTVTGSNIGNKVTTSATAPSSPSVGDVWVDTST